MHAEGGLLGRQEAKVAKAAHAHLAAHRVDLEVGERAWGVGVERVDIGVWFQLQRLDIRGSC